MNVPSAAVLHDSRSSIHSHPVVCTEHRKYSLTMAGSGPGAVEVRMQTTQTLFGSNVSCYVCKLGIIYPAPDRNSNNFLFRFHLKTNLTL